MWTSERFAIAPRVLKQCTRAANIKEESYVSS